METSPNVTSANSDSSVKKPSKTLIFAAVGIIIALVAAIGALVLISQNGNQSQNNSNGKDQDIASDLPANTCPDSVTLENGRPVAIYKGKNVQMSQETYNWVKQNCDTNGSNSDEDIVIENLGVMFGNYDAMTGRAGSFVFDQQSLKNNSEFPRILLEFGSSKVENGVKVDFPELVYQQVDADTNVMALAGGKVVESKFQDFSNDYAVSVLFNDTWVVNYDHLTALEVDLNDTVQAGDVLGKVSLNRDGVTGFTEIQVKKVVGSNSTSYCATDYLSPVVKTIFQGYISKLMSDWESYVGDTNVYDEAAQVAPGCLVKSLKD